MTGIDTVCFFNATSLRSLYIDCCWFKMCELQIFDFQLIFGIEFGEFNHWKFYTFKVTLD